MDHVKIESIREGVYLLWRLGYREEARVFALGRKDDLIRCNALINRKIGNELLRNEGNAATVKRIAVLQNHYRERLISESQISWIKNDENACVYFWLYMYEHHSSASGTDLIDDILSKSRNRSRRKPGYRHDRHDLRIPHSELPVVNVSNPAECFTAALLLMDLLPLKIIERNDILDKMASQYKYASENIGSDFPWFVGAENKHVAWVWNKFKEHNQITEAFDMFHIGPDVMARAIPFVYYLWDEKRDAKLLFLNGFRKRFANMKHREKVSDKEPVNIRVSKGTKKTLEKLEKRFNRSRADVIEYLIEKAWAELNQKN